MSLGAFAMIVWFVAVHGIVHQPDESAQAHLWQLLLFGQVPFIAYFGFRWLSKVRRPALVVLALQAAALLFLAVAPYGRSAAYSSRLRTLDPASAAGRSEPTAPTPTVIRMGRSWSRLTRADKWFEAFGQADSFGVRGDSEGVLTLVRVAYG
jgi:hypothetical protein